MKYKYIGENKIRIFGQVFINGQVFDTKKQIKHDLFIKLNKKVNNVDKL